MVYIFDGSDPPHPLITTFHLSLCCIQDRCTMIQILHWGMVASQNINILSCSISCKQPSHFDVIGHIQVHTQNSCTDLCGMFEVHTLRITFTIG